MKVLSIDPSSSAPGFALFENGSPIWCETVKIKGPELLERMRKVMLLLQHYLIEHSPDYIAIESPYLGLSASVSMSMGKMYGMLCALIILNNYDVEKIIEIHPMTAKKAAGIGHFKNRKEGKETLLQKMIEQFPHLEITDDNSGDALAVGLAALQYLQDKEK